MIIKSCKKCGGEFKTYPSKVKQGKGKYCSRKCSNEVTLIKKGQRLSPGTEFKKNKRHKHHSHITYAVAREVSKPYRLVYKPNHPNATNRGYVREHRLVMEKAIGRYISPDEVVHHLDGDTLNNSVENLQIMGKRCHDRMNTHLNIHKRWVMRGGAAKSRQ